MNKKATGLGMGLGSLIPKNTLQKESNVFNIELAKIRSNPNQPRKNFDKVALEELASSIKKYGILQPIVVTKIPKETINGLDVEYEVVAGERRLRAALSLGLPSIPVMIKDDFEEEKVKLEVALIENLQREDLNPLEEAEAYYRLSKDFGYTHSEIGDKLGKSREVISNCIRLMDLPDYARQAMLKGQLSKSQGRAMLAFKTDNKKMKQIFEQFTSGGLATSDVEAMAKDHFGTRDQKYGKSANLERYEELQNNLSSRFDTAVLIRSGANGGSIKIKFADIEHLNKIVKLILDA